MLQIKTTVDVPNLRCRFQTAKPNSCQFVDIGLRFTKDLVCRRGNLYSYIYVTIEEYTYFCGFPSVETKILQ